MVGGLACLVQGYMLYRFREKGTKLAGADCDIKAEEGFGTSVGTETINDANYSSRVNEGTGTVDVYETASHGVKKTKKRLLFFSSECLEKL